MQIKATYQNPVKRCKTASKNTLETIKQIVVKDESRIRFHCFGALVESLVFSVFREWSLGHFHPLTKLMIDIDPF